MPARLLTIMASLWNQQRAAWESGGTPAAERRFLPVIPVVLYTGDDPWKMDMSLADVMDLPGPLGRFVPRFDVLTFDVKGSQAEELAAGRHPFEALLLAVRAENASAEELQAALVEAVRRLGAMAETDPVAWERALVFLYLLVRHRRAPAEARPMLDALTQRAQRQRGRAATEMAQTLAEYLIEQGVERGQVKAKQEDVLAILSERFGTVPEPVAEKVRQQQDLPVLDGLFRRAIHAESLDAMGL